VQCTFVPDMRCAVPHEQCRPDNVTGLMTALMAREHALASPPACTCSHGMSGLIS